MARISVLGGTGYAGGALVTEAQRRGHEVTSVSRSAPTEPVPGVDHVEGSVLAPDLLKRVVDGRDVVIVAIPARGDMTGEVEGLVDRLIDLASSDGFRLGVIGGASSLLLAEGGPRLFDVSDPPPAVRPEIETGLALLETLKGTPESVDWFYVSPPETFGAWAPAPDTGSYRLSDDILLREADGTSTISATDLARAVLDEIEQPRHRRRRFHAAH